MSQSGSFSEGSVAPGIETVSGNSGGAVGPDASYNINIIGGAGVNIAGNAGTNTLTVSLTGGSAAIDSLIPNSGTSPVTPDAGGAITLVGTGSITNVGSLNTITTQLTGLTNHNVLVGAGTSTITKVAPSATSGVPFISQGAASDPVFGTALVPGGGTGATSFTANSVLLGNGTSAVSSLGAATNGQLIIGNTGNAPSLAVLTSSDSSVDITNGAGSINLSVETHVDETDITPFVVGPTGKYATIQDGLDAADLAGGGIVAIQPKAGVPYVENLTLYDNTEVVSIGSPQGDTVAINGSHTPPTSGTFVFRNVKLMSGAVFSSVAAGNTTLVCENCEFSFTNSSIFNLPNWTGDLYIKNCIDSSTLNRIAVNPNGTLYIYNSNVGAGGGAGDLDGNSLIINSRINCPLNLNSGGHTSTNSAFYGTITHQGTASSAYSNFTISTGSNSAFIQTSSGNLSLYNGVIDSGNAQVIAGNGPVSYSGLEFISNSSVSGSITFSAAGNSRDVNSIVKSLNVDSFAASDSYVSYTVNGSTTNALGVDVSASNIFKLTTGANPSAGTTLFAVNPSNGLFAVEGPMACTSGIGVGGSFPGTEVNVNLTNTGTIASSDALVEIATLTTGGDPFVNIGVVSGSQYSIGVDNSDSDILKITNGANPSSGTTVFTATSAGAVTIPGGSFTVSGGGIGISGGGLTVNGGSIIASRENSGSDVSISLENSSNTASSTAFSYHRVGGTSAGDPYTAWSVNGGGDFTAGIDNSVTGDPWRLCASASLGTTTAIECNSSAFLTYPSQPIFLAYLTSTVTDVTGDDTGYTILFDTTAFNVSSSYDTGTGTFTCLSGGAGTYWFYVCVLLRDLSASHTDGFVNIVSSSGTSITADQQNVAAIRFGANNNAVIKGGGLLSLSEGNTVTAVVDVRNGTKTVDIEGSSNYRCYFLAWKVT